MAELSKRQLQVGEMLKRNFSEVLQSEGLYVYGAEPLVTVTNVIVTPDLALAKMYLSVYNVEHKQHVVDQVDGSLHLLKNSLVPRIRKHVRRIPALAVYIDETLDEMYKLNALFDEINAKEKDN